MCPSGGGSGSFQLRFARTSDILRDGDRKEGEANVRKGVEMHIRALTKKSPDLAANTDVNGVVFALDVLAAILSMAFQIQAFIANANAKKPTTT
jgi:hypothetical protein